jgi:hypothetical protein
VPPKFIEIEGKRLSWRDVLQLRRAQVADGTLSSFPLQDRRESPLRANSGHQTAIAMPLPGGIF